MTDPITGRKRSVASEVEIQQLLRQVGQLVRVLRAERGLTQEALADRALLSVDAVRRLEQGAFAASLRTLGKLAQAFDLTLPSLFARLEPGRARSARVQALADLLARRPERDLERVWRLLQALFNEP